MEQSHKLLIVDDEPFMREGLKIYLDWQSFSIGEVLLAENAHTALEIARAQQPDIIMTDIRMPEMTGLELIEKVKLLLPDCVCIIISGFNDFAYAKQSMELGAFAYLVKPLEMEEVKNVITSAVDAYEKRSAEKAALRRLHEGERRSLKLLRREFFSLLISQASHLSSEQLHYYEKHTALRTDCECFAVCVTRLLRDHQPHGAQQLYAALESGLEHINNGTDGWSMHFIEDGSLVSLLAGRERIVAHMCALLRDELRNVQGGFPLLYTSVRGGTVHSLNDIALCRDEAQKLCEYKAFFGEAGFFECSSEKRRAGESPLLLSNEEKGELQLYLQNSNADGIARMMERIRDNAPRLSGQTLGVLFSMVLELMISAMRQLESRKILLDQYMNIEILSQEFLESFDSFGLLLEWLSGFFVFISNALSDRDSPEIENRIVDSMKDYVRAHYASNVNLLRIAEHCHYNSNYLGRVFKNYMGVKFSEYLNSVRIGHVKELLLTTDFSIEEIAGRTGYNDPQYLIKVFKSHMGVTPGRFRSR